MARFDLSLSPSPRQLPPALGLVAFVWFAWGVAPGPYWLDAQELGAAAVTLGSPHPTGFPLSMLAGKLGSLLPVGELAFRVHLVSAGFAAVAVALAARLVLELCGEGATALVGAAGAGVTLAVSGTFLGHASATEVYAPLAALLALAALLGLGAARGSRRAGLALALCAGVAAAGGHAELRWLVLAPMPALWIWRLRRGERWPLAAPALAALGFAGTLAYLPLRSGSAAGVELTDWGHPSTLAGLWDHAIAAARIRAAYGEEMLSGDAELVAQGARAFAALVERDLGVPALLLAGCGAIWLLWARRARLGGALLLAWAAADAAYAVWVNPMGLADRQNGVPLLLVAAVLGGCGAVALARRFGRGAPFAAAVMVFVGAAPAALSSASARAAVAGSEAPRAWAEAALADAPPRAIALVQADSTAAGLIWLGVAEGARPDVAVLVRQHLWDARRTRAVLARVELAGDTALFESGRPVRWEPGVDAPPRGVRLQPGVPLAAAGATAAADDPAAVIAAAARRLDRIFAHAAGDANARRLHASALGALGRQALAARLPALAESLLTAAVAVDPESAAAHTNLGVLAAARGDFLAAFAHTERAIALDPASITARLNAARYALALGNDAAARAHATRAVRLAPRRAEAHTLLGIILARAGDFPAARASLERALALDPTDTEALTTLRKLGDRI